MSDQDVSNQGDREAAVRVARGGEVVASMASFAALVCAPQRPTSRDAGRLRELEERVLLELEELRARRGRGGRR